MKNFIRALSAVFLLSAAAVQACPSGCGSWKGTHPMHWGTYDRVLHELAEGRFLNTRTCEDLEPYLDSRTVMNAFVEASQSGGARESFETALTSGLSAASDGNLSIEKTDCTGSPVTAYAGCYLLSGTLPTRKAISQKFAFTQAGFHAF